jgi:hypothetical protein
MASVGGDDAIILVDGVFDADRDCLLKQKT